MKNRREATWHNCLRLGWVRSNIRGRLVELVPKTEWSPNIIMISCLNHILIMSVFWDPQKLLYVFVSKLFLKTIHLSFICQQNIHSFVFYIKAFDAKPYSFRALIAINGVLVMLWVHRKSIANKRVLLSTGIAIIRVAINRVRLYLDMLKIYQ